jgi:predicted Zn finger-like uncharacterized protein
MKITCPNCATRYDVDDARFVPDGRSVRCAECDESWFVPAPEPIEDLVPLRPHASASRSDEGRDYDEARRREKPETWRDARGRDYRDEDRRDQGRYQESRRDEDPQRRHRDDAIEEPVDEPLFDNDEPPARRTMRFRIEEEFQDEAPRAHAERASAPRRDSRGRFIKSEPAREDRRRDESHYEEPPARAARVRGERDEGPSSFGARETDRHVRHEEDTRRRAEAPSPPRDRRAPQILDADFEDIDRPTHHDGVDDGRGFGRRIRDERRRATALARIEDLDPVAERVFNDEFFKALHVQPKELERAIRKARRRAEAREKNRLTPLRALGWSAFFGVVALAGFAAYAYRDSIVALAPKASGAYEAVGIEAHPYGLKIEGVTHRVALSTNGPVIEILGRLKNESAATISPPMLQAEAVGVGGETLAKWTFAARSATVKPGESADFSTRTAAPEGVSEVLLSFAPTEGVKVSVGDLLKPATR